MDPAFHIRKRYTAKNGGSDYINKDADSIGLFGELASGCAVRQPSLGCDLSMVPRETSTCGGKCLITRQSLLAFKSTAASHIIQKRAPPFRIVTAASEHLQSVAPRDCRPGINMQLQLGLMGNDGGCRSCSNERKKDRKNNVFSGKECKEPSCEFSAISEW